MQIEKLVSIVEFSIRSFGTNCKCNFKCSNYKIKMNKHKSNFSKDKKARHYPNLKELFKGKDTDLCNLDREVRHLRTRVMSH